MPIVRVFLLFVLGLIACGCATAWCPDSGVGLGNTCGQGTSSSNSGSNNGGGGGGGGGTGQLYVSDAASSFLARFASATTITGNILPTAVTQGNLTQLATPGFITADTVNNRLYVANTAGNSVLVFDNISSATGNIAPVRVLSGSNTQLDHPVQVELDTVNNQLYVANAGTNSVVVFTNATTTQGNVAPARSLSGAGTQITSISSIHLEIANDRLWVADPTAGALLVFEPASTLSGAPAPGRVVSGSNTQLQSPRFILQTGTTLFISCTASIVRFQGSDAIAGNLAPAAVLTGGLTNLVTPQQLAYRSDSDELYVTDSAATSVSVFAQASSASAGPAPTRTLSGANTGLVGPTGMALDLTR